jgi:hypothetical protein
MFVGHRASYVRGRINVILADQRVSSIWSVG